MGRARRRPPGRQPPLVGQRGQPGFPAAAHLADHVAGRDPGLLHEHLVERGVAVHLPQRPDLHARLVHRQHEVRDTAVLRRAEVRPGQQQAEVRMMGRGVPHLLPGHHPAAVGAVGVLARVVSPARSEPAPGSLNSWHQVISPVTVGRMNFPQRLRAVLQDRRRRPAARPPRPARTPHRPGDLLGHQRGQPGGSHGRTIRAARTGRPTRSPPAAPAIAAGSAPDPSSPRATAAARRARRPRPAAGHRPSKRGGRRWAEAAMPSRKSAVCRSRFCSAFAVGRRPDPVRQRPAHRLPDRPHRERAPTAISAAISYAAARRPSGSASRSASPIPAASSPPTRRPVHSRSSARCSPTIPGSVTVSAKP